MRQASTPTEKSAATRRGEFIAEQMARSNDFRLLREMVGDRCYGRQRYILHYYDRPVRQIAGKRDDG